MYEEIVNSEREFESSSEEEGEEEDEDEVATGSNKWKNQVLCYIGILYLMQT